METRRRALIIGGLAAVGLLSAVGGLEKEYAQVTSAGAEEVDSETGPTDETPSDQRTGQPDGDVLNVRDYGAEGDGETDDSGAIEDAIKAAEPGQTVFLPETEDAYLLSFDGRNTAEAAIDLDGESGLDGVTVIGERAAEGAQTLQVESGSYNPARINTIIRITANQTITGLVFRNLTLDGARPPDDGPAANGGENALGGLYLRAGNRNGGHDIRITDCVVRNCSSNAFRFEESGVRCQYVTARQNGRHGFNPVAGDTAADPGFAGWSLKAVDNGGTGIDHRRGTAAIHHLYTRNNRSGNKWKHFVDRLEVTNHHSVGDQNHGWRSNHSSGGDYNAGSAQQVVFDRVFIENPDRGGIRVSGSDVPVEWDIKGVEVRGASLGDATAGVVALRDVDMRDPGTGRMVVVGTANGPGVEVWKATVDIDTYEHEDNDGGGFNVSRGNFRVDQNRNFDPGRNIFRTPEPDDVGAFNRMIPEGQRDYYRQS